MRCVLLRTARNLAHDAAAAVDWATDWAKAGEVIAVAVAAHLAEVAGVPVLAVWRLATK
jgi:hypothetical protein